MLARDHLLVVSRDYQPQWFELTRGDLAVTYLVLRALDGFGFYNSDRRAGASQRHKHLQSERDQVCPTPSSRPACSR